MAEPKLRFKRDDGSNYPILIEKKLGDIGTVLMCKRVFREQTDTIGDVPFFKIGTFGGVPDAFISQQLFENLRMKYSFPKKGNILLSAAGTIGRVVRYNGEDAFFQDSNIVWLDHDTSVLDDYLYYFYQQVSWKNLEGGTIQRLYNSILLDKDISIPCLEEQQKIADFLSAVDEVIAESEKEAANLEAQKKAVMKKIFSQEIRFTRSDGSPFPDWKEKQLERLGKIIGGGTPKTSEKSYWNGSIPWISSADLEENDIHSVNISRYITEDAIRNSSTKIVQKNSLLIITRVGVGKVAISPCELCTSQDYMSISIEYDNSIFIGYAVSNLMQIRIKNVQGTSIKGIPSDEVKNYEINIPCLEEQKLIADFLSDFDEAIAAAQKELSLWKKLKKALLQQLFV